MRCRILVSSFVLLAALPAVAHAQGNGRAALTFARYELAGDAGELLLKSNGAISSGMGDLGNVLIRVNESSNQPETFLAVVDESTFEFDPFFNFLVTLVGHTPGTNIPVRITILGIFETSTEYVDVTVGDQTWFASRLVL
jgi:hypothetical protein